MEAAVRARTPTDERRITANLPCTLDRFGGASAAANVIVAHGEVAGDELETALTGVLASPILEKGYDLLMLDEALHEAIGRVGTRAGRAENLRRVAAIAGRPITQREGVFRVAVDVADYDGIAAIERAALPEIAAALLVDVDALLKTAQPKRS